MTPLTGLQGSSRAGGIQEGLVGPGSGLEVGSDRWCDVRATKAKGQLHVLFKPLPVPHWPVLVTVKFRVNGQESPSTHPAAVESGEQE